MKHYPHAALRLLFTLCLPALTGCINDDLSMCTSPDNLVLAFRLESAAGTDFLEKLHSVDVMLFDHQGVFVDRQRLERDDLEAFRGARFSVFAGDYLVTAWANVASGSRLPDFVVGESRIDEGFVEMQGAGDSLYYAPAKGNAYTGEAALRAAGEAADPYALHRVHVPYGQGSQVVKELPFTRAYRSVNVFVKGLETFGRDAGGTLPVSVEASNLAARYDLLFNTQLERRDEIRTFAAALTPGGTLPVARFYSAYGPISGDMSFSVTHLPDEPESVTIRLREWLSDNPPSSFDDIDILVEFQRAAGGNVQVNITLPDWSTLPVIPEM
jgi:hypothetical protein